ncbi:unnamed protein product, partial [Mesorhabditis belari]|uniref:Core Histone H2A/H2B/H3 domain-containing protein n=1 Tax=Mesorhabditis belari TaxID=2138241 RepID=A0AAF3J2Y8_9BILA
MIGVIGIVGNLLTVWVNNKKRETVDLQIPKLAFFKVMKEIMQRFQPDFRVQSLVVDALREAAEVYLTETI